MSNRFTMTFHGDETHAVVGWVSRRHQRLALGGWQRVLSVSANILVMWHAQTVDRFQSEYLALQSIRAGSALACAYSSSDEFEAAVIRSRLDAGIYGPKRRRRHAAYAVIAAGIVIAAFLML